MASYVSPGPYFNASFGNFKKQETSTNIIKLTAHHTNNFYNSVSPYDNADLSYIVNELVYQIAEQIVKSNMYVFKYERDEINKNSRYTMDIFVAKTGNYGVISDYGYMVNNKIFTHEQIVEAIENTYPEKFI